ncbi:MAG TPA: hypothetical protein VK590_13770 [Saprospiraceae bacterium]|nr:hypothetical protein [Saprospiraceae bacterium]
MIKLLCILFILGFGCNQKKNLLKIKNNLQGFQIELNNLEYFNYELESKIQNEFCTFLVFASHNRKGLGPTYLSLYSGLKGLNVWKEENGIFSNFNMSNDSLEKIINENRQYHLINIKSISVGKFKGKIFFLSENYSKYLTTKCLMKKDSVFISFHNGCLNEIKDYFLNSEKLIKSIKICEIEKLNK